MNICLISQEYPPETNLGGIATYTQTLARQLVRMGQKVHVLTYAKEKEYIVDDMGVSVHRLLPILKGELDEHRKSLLEPYTKQHHWILGFSQRAYEYFISLHGKEQFDVIEAPDTCAQALFIYKFVEGPKKIVRLHTPFFWVRRLNNIPDSPDNSLRESLEREQAFAATDITSPTHALADIVKKEWEIRDIPIIPNFFNLDYYKPDLSIYDQYLKDQKYIIYYGRLEYRKGVQVLAPALRDVLSRHESLKVAFVGDDSMYNNASMKEGIQEVLKDFYDRVVFIPNIPHDSLYPLIERAEFVVLPSLWENFPYTCLEGMALGKVVIATRGSGFSEIIDDGINGFLCNPDDSNALRDQILDCLNRNDIGMIGDKAAEKVKVFDNSTMVGRMLEYYRSPLPNRKRKLTILYPTSMFPKLSETFILEQITNLIDLGHDVKIVAFYRPDEKIFHPQIEKYDLLSKTLYIKKIDKEPGFEFSPEVLDFLKDVDIIHSHFAALPTDFAMHASKLLGIPYVFTTHAYDIFVHTKPDKLAEYASSAARIITISEFNKNFMLEMIGDGYRNKVDIIRCGIDVERFSSGQRKASDTVRVLTTGRFVEKKGIIYAIRAFAKLPAKCNAVLRIIGDGPLRSEIENAISELKINHKVELLGALPQSEVIKEMQRADIFTLPSVTASNNDKEGLPVSILEAQAMKLPVVSTFHSGIPEGVIDGQTAYLVPERDVDTLAAKLVELIENPSLRQEMGERGRRHVDANFNIHYEIAKLERIMNDVVFTQLTQVDKGDTGFMTPSPEKPDRKIKVLFVSHSSYFFGAEQSFLFLLENLDRQIFDPVVTLPESLPNGTLQARLEKLDIKTYILNSPRRWIDFPVNGDPLEALCEEVSVIDTFRDIIAREKIDIVYTNTITKISAAIAAKLSKVPHIYHVREILKDHPLESIFSDDTAFRIVHYLSDHIITNSRFVLKQFSELSLNDKIDYVYNAIDVSSFTVTCNTHKFRKELNLGKKVPLVGILGSVHRHKNHEDLIRAFAVLKKRNFPAKLVVIGHLFHEYYELLQALIDTYGLQDRVIFLPFRDDILEIIHDLDLIVVASLAEPFGRTTIEAMAAGKPVVATDTGASPEIVEDGVTGYLVPLHAPEKMADAIIKILSDPKKKREMGVAGRQRVSELFNPESYITGIQNIFHRTFRATEFSESAGDITGLNKMISDLKDIIPEAELEVQRDQLSKFYEHPGHGSICGIDRTGCSLLARLFDVSLTPEGSQATPLSISAHHEETMTANKKKSARLITFYLPQFHPIPENDEWWGKGFTEWANVSKAKPQFPGHRQPHLPTDLGFYDLRLPEARKAQAEMAREHGIEAFCYWHYWFEGKRLLERPFNEVLQSGEPDFSFCLAWANETWSRRWLGEEKDILMQQSYSPEDDLNHVHWLLPVFADPRCVKVNGRPLFLIYRPKDLPDPQRTTDLFRNECIRNGLPEPFLIGINSHCWNLDCRSIGFDGTLLFMPQLGNLPEFMNDDPSETKRERNIRLGVESDKLKIYDYEESLVTMLSNRKKYDHPVYPSIFVGWDNTPRRGENGIIIVNSEPAIFGKHLSELIDEVQQNPPDERFVFVNAWNEWAEGNHLEPDNWNGRGYLEEIRRINGPILSASSKQAKAPITITSTSSVSASYTQLIKTIAFFLPQYHPIPENDEWWGNGFTEWTNVSKAKPLFSDHYQPHLPSDLGFYDLRLSETRKAQAALASEYGITGFCYYHYWFNGKLLLEKPIHAILESGEPDFPFCLCWANEPWTRTWDGKPGEALMPQSYSEDDDKTHIWYLSHFFKDPRYIRINGKPLFMIYRANHIPDPLKTTTIMREEARKLGIGELYLCRVESFSNERNDPTEIGFDAAVEFQPDWLNLGDKLSEPIYSQHKVYDYEEVVKRALAKEKPSYRRFPCVMPSWDNTPRRPDNATVFLNSNPQIFGNWLYSTLVKELNEDYPEKVVFINAWNEWGEGNHLEPDQKFGRGFLEATRNAIMKASQQQHISSSDAALQQLITKQDSLLMECNQQIKAKDSLIIEKEQMITKKNQLLEEQNKLINERDNLLAEREQRIQDLLNSVSWRITEPLRKGYELVLKSKKKTE